MIKNNIYIYIYIQKFSIQYSLSNYISIENETTTNICNIDIMICFSFFLLTDLRIHIRIKDLH